MTSDSSGTSRPSAVGIAFDRRQRLLPGCVEVGSAYVRAVAAHATGAVLLAEGATAAALTSLRGGWVAWREVDAPYDGARTRVLIAHACLGLGDIDAAEMELDAALHLFR